MQSTRTIIVGGGPAGLITAIELGRRGVPCVVLEEDATTPEFPKANATTSRTMEHYRRLGFAAEIRALGLPEDYPQDITYFTRFTRHELARLKGLTRREAVSVRESAYSRWPTPEPLHRTQQMYIERVLTREAAKYPAIDLRFGWRAVRIEQDVEGVRAFAVGPGDAQEVGWTAEYLVGCDGPRSLVREAIDVRYSGLSNEQRDFMGGRMLAVYLRAPALYDVISAERSWQYWAINREQRALMCAIEGEALFVFHVQLAPGQTGTRDFAERALVRATGCEFPHEIIGIAEWTAGFTLVAERFSAGRVFLAGDAAHLFTPTAGQGYNTSVDDAANLGWKLAAVCQGWGGSHLLTSYEQERQPIAHRNTRFARSMAESIGRIEIPGDIEAESAAASRTALGESLYDHAAAEFDIPGVHFGVFYGGSPIVVSDGSPAPIDDPHRYTPNTTPGARAPHLWLRDGSALFDHFGRDFTLLKLGGSADTGAIEAATRSLGIPLKVLTIDEPEARDLYARDLVLVRPDQHVAWRGNHSPDNVLHLIRRTTGHVP